MATEGPLDSYAHPYLAGLGKYIFGVGEAGADCVRRPMPSARNQTVSVRPTACLWLVGRTRREPLLPHSALYVLESYVVRHLTPA